MRLYLGIALSTLIHLLLYLLAPEQLGITQEPEITVEIQYVDKAKPLTFLDSSIPDQVMKPEIEPEDEADLWSKERIRVTEQSRAKITGETANRAPKVGRQQLRQQAKPDVVDMAQKHIASMDVPSTQSRQAFTALEQGFSTLGEPLDEEIPVGHFTALNVDPYLYYSFFSRMGQQIRPRWTDAVLATFESLASIDFRSTQTKWITHIEVELNHDGEFLNAYVIKESGLRSLDLAAVRSFRQAKYFPNPPKDLINDEGRVLLRYSFEVISDPRRLVRRH